MQGHQADDSLLSYATSKGKASHPSCVNHRWSACLHGLHNKTRDLSPMAYQIFRCLKLG